MKIRIEVGLDTGASAEFEKEDYLLTRGPLDRARASLDKAYAEACTWLDSQRSKAEVDEVSR